MTMKFTQPEFYPEQWVIYERISAIARTRHHLKVDRELARGDGASDFHIEKLTDKIEGYYAEARALRHPFCYRILAVCRVSRTVIALSIRGKEERLTDGFRPVT